MGNTQILVVTEPRLHKPMDFFLISLSALDIPFKMLSLFLLGGHFLAFPPCSLHMYLLQSFTCSEAVMLVGMAHNHYVPICCPLHCPVHMTPQTNAALVATAWLTALLRPIPAVVKTSQMAYDNAACLYRCFCDQLALVRSSCCDTTPQTLVGFCVAVVVSFLPLLLVRLSYVHILASVLCVRSREGRSKAFSTCRSHVLVVGTYCSSTAIAYVSYRAELPLSFHVMGNGECAILSPVFNPLIYTLRNKDVKAAIKMACHQMPRNIEKP